MAAAAPAPTVPGVRPGPDPRTGPARPASDRPPSLRENFERSLPVLAGGALCLGVAAVLVHGPAHLLGLRLPIWPLLGAVGLTLVGGGCALTISEEPPPAGPDLSGGEYVLVNRGVWLDLQSAVVQARRAAAESVAQPPWAETPVERNGESAPLWVAPAVVDTLAVESASRELLREAHPRTVTPGQQQRTGPSSPPAALGTLPSTQGVASPTRPMPTTGPGAPSGPVAPTQEFASVLSLLERAEASVRTRLHRTAPVGAHDRCISCGISVSAYSEQLCVMCDRPLCDRCVDLTAASGHPQMCDTCHNAFRPEPT